MDSGGKKDLKQSSTKLASHKVSARVGNSSQNVQGGSYKVMLDGKNVTPRSLMPTAPRAAEVEDIDRPAKEEDEEEKDEETPEPDHVLPTSPHGGGLQAKLEKERKEAELRAKLNEICEIRLSETPTMQLLALPSLCIHIEHEQHTVVSN